MNILGSRIPLRVCSILIHNYRKQTERATRNIKIEKRIVRYRMYVKYVISTALRAKSKMLHEQDFKN